MARLLQRRPASGAGRKKPRRGGDAGASGFLGEPVMGDAHHIKDFTPVLCLLGNAECAIALQPLDAAVSPRSGALLVTRFRAKNAFTGERQ